MDIRNELVDEVRRYFVGPYEPNEHLHDYPDEIYVSGMLFPKRTEQGSEDGDEFHTGSSDDEAGVRDEGRYRAGFLQNSIGIRCNIAPSVTEITADVEYARYSLEGESWQRIPIESKSLQIDLNSKESHVEIRDRDGNSESKITWDVEMDSHTPERHTVLSIFLSNEIDQADDTDESGGSTYKHRKIDTNQRIIFQPRISIRSPDGDRIFVGAGADSGPASGAPEETSLDLLFRNRQVFAQGYNCSAGWDAETKSPPLVRTETVPVYDSKRILFSSKDDDDKPDEIDMVRLDRAESPAEVRQILEPMLSKYRSWIERVRKQTDVINSRNANMADAAKENHRRCLSALDRMRDGLNMLEDVTRPEVFESFKLANRAMLDQRARYDFAVRVFKKKGAGRPPDAYRENTYFWRPFQIAFLLMNLRGVGDGQSPQGREQRETVDLLWFPTGGGKTEAYLALAAFSMILRRIRGADTDHMGLGVSVVMRYTLRLLTLQQFERAATLMCALEILRRRNSAKLGSEPFLIGLWVGYSLTPNSQRDSDDAIKKLCNGEPPRSGSPAQLNFCPWCGSGIKCDKNQNNYYFDRKTKWTLVHCPNRGCNFYSQDRRDVMRAIPVVTVDEDIYRRCPALLISTVDKFARLPWKPETSSLFGLVDRRCPRCGFFGPSSDHPSYHRGSPRVTTDAFGGLNGPDLIIQDELHLITGPLGTMVGLYETAVGYLSSDSTSGTVPKIVVSTATVRGARDQIRKLYNRKKLDTFPPPAIDYSDSFFWWESDEPGRRYVGLSYSHRSAKFALGRLYSSLLQRVFEVHRGGGDAGAVDSYWTLVAYFNSIRELGGAIRLVEDDVRSNIRNMIGILDFHSGSEGRPLGEPEELTGRRTGAEIKELRDRLEQDMDSQDSIDVLLATNMISVGIDVERFGLMVIHGQTRNTTEYIQATGRIGRRAEVPGLVFTLYNPYKPRDLSHYENFTGMHATLQKYVEPASLTPFSDRAMERALHAVLLSLVRLTIDNLAKNDEAGNFERTDQRIDMLVRAIAERYASVQDLSISDPDRLQAVKILHLFLDNWRQEIDKLDPEERFYYHDDSEYVPYGTVEKKENVMMIDFAEKETTGGNVGFPKKTPGSLRDVEAEAGMFYI